MRFGILILLFFGFSLSSFGQIPAKQFCLGAVGKQCAVPASAKGPPSPLNRVACSKVEKGQTNCWVSPGSILHDNCCLRHPNGVLCSSETKNDGHCMKEWEAAYRDIAKKGAWYHIFNIKEKGNVAPVLSKRMKKFGGREAQSTAALCAPGGTKLLAIHDSGFCCAGRAKKQKDVMICSEESRPQIAAKAKKSKSSLDTIFKQIDDLIKQLASLKGPEKKAAEKKIDNLKAEAKKMELKEQIAMKPQAMPPPLPQLPLGTQTTFDYGRGPNMPPPQPMQEEQEELEQPTYYEEPVAMRPEPVEEAQPYAGQPCDPDFPKYTQPGCIETKPEGPPPTQGQPCNPGVPRYAQPGCVE